MTADTVTPEPHVRFWNSDGRLDLYVNGGVVRAEMVGPDGAVAVHVPLARLRRAVRILALEDGSLF